MRNKTRPAGIAALGLGLLATVLFLAGPAAAGTPDHHSLGPDANHGSVTSGSAEADWGSTASGDAKATNGSVASGCSDAHNESTASGGVCHPKPDHHMKPDHKKHHGVGGAAPASAVQTRALAVTGSTTVPLALAAAALLALGGLMVALTSDRRRAITLQ